MYLHYAPHIKVRIFFHTDLCIRIYQRTYKWIYTPIHMCTYLRMYMTNNFANNANICTLWDAFSYDKKKYISATKLSSSSPSFPMQRWLQARRFCIEAITAAALLLYMLGIFHSLQFTASFFFVNMPQLILCCTPFFSNSFLG